MPEINDHAHPAYKVTVWQNFDSFTGALNVEPLSLNGQGNVLFALPGIHLLKK
jgi:hypothetical protein